MQGLRRCWLGTPSLLPHSLYTQARAGIQMRKKPLPFKGKSWKSHWKWHGYRKKQGLWSLLQSTILAVDHEDWLQINTGKTDLNWGEEVISHSGKGSLTRCGAAMRQRSIDTPISALSADCTSKSCIVLLLFLFYWEKTRNISKM